MINIMKEFLTAEEIDHYIGQKLKFRRLMIGKTLDDVGKLVGVSFQQIQKYERGQNSISSSRLFYLAKALDVDTSYFFEQINNTNNSVSDSSQTEFDSIVNVNDRELISIIKSYSMIKDANIRKKLTELVKALSE
jgi:transcriptional regulator with XRE-family HTH domain